MQVEPEYVFVKGQGWVVMAGTVTTTKNGKLVRLEYRAPKMGEYYDFFHLDNPQFFKDNQPIWERWFKQVNNFTYGTFCIRERFDDIEPDVYGYMVLVPL